LLVGAGANPSIEGWMKITPLQSTKERKGKEDRRVYELLLKEAKKDQGLLA